MCRTHHFIDWLETRFDVISIIIRGITIPTKVFCALLHSIFCLHCDFRPGSQWTLITPSSANVLTLQSAPSHHQISRFLSALPLMCNSQACLKGVFMWQQAQWLTNCSEKKKKTAWCESLGDTGVQWQQWHCVPNIIPQKWITLKGYRLLLRLTGQQMTQNHKWWCEDKPDCSPSLTFTW